MRIPTKISLMLFVFLIVMGWFLYQKGTDDTFEGMSIIPEKQKDIPLFEGLEPTNRKYVIEGNHWNEIYEYYLITLLEVGWELESKGSAFNDDDPENDWSGFHSRWRKEGFDGELSISASYNQLEEQTEVTFDQTPIYNSTAWINNVPESICIYQTLHDEKCSEVTDKRKIKQIVGFINEAIDWQDEVLPREKSGVIDFGGMNIKIHYEEEKEIYVQSEKGTKLMKPEPDFFKLTNFSQ